MQPRHPVYVISKGRSDCCLTANFMLRDQLHFRLVIEPTPNEFGMVLRRVKPAKVP